MDSIHKALFPGVAAGILLIILLASVANAPAQAEAAPADAAAPQAVTQAAPAVAPDLEVWVAQTIAKIFAPLVMLSPLPAPTPIPTPTATPASPEPANPPAESHTEEGCPLSPGYPERVRRWCAWIADAASQNGLDPELVAALVQVESGGNPEALSRSGAVGLMQVMPRDGRAAGFYCPNGPCFARRPSMQELYDPQFNLQYGCGMLAGLLNRHGSLREALRAYGPAGAGYSYADKVLGVYQRNR